MKKGSKNAKRKLKRYGIISKKVSEESESDDFDEFGRPNYHLPPPIPLAKFEELIPEFLQCMTSVLHLRNENALEEGYKLSWSIPFKKKMGVRAKKKGMSALAELIEYNVFEEYKGILTNPLANPNTIYAQARLLVYRYIITMVMKDPYGANAELTREEYKLSREELTRAGKLLHKEGGMESMHDPLLWSFIPKSFHHEIDTNFSGIGDWLA